MINNNNNNNISNNTANTNNKQSIPKISQNQLIGDSKVIKKLICGVCKDMLNNPQMCNKCMNIWCYKCCTNDIQYNNNNPQQQQHSQQMKCPNNCQDIILLKSPPLLDELFKIIKIKCYFHENRQQEPTFICPKILEYNEYNYHYQVCEYGYEQCDIIECQQIIKRKDIEEHKKICPSREVLMKMIKNAHLKTISSTNIYNQILSLTDRVKKENENLQVQIVAKQQKLEQIQSFQLNQCRKCLHYISTQNNNNNNNNHNK